MSDDRISPTPNAPRCPVCATGFTDTPGAKCPACGKVLGPLPVPSTKHDFRLRAERFRLDGPGWVVLGIVLLCGALLLALMAPGFLGPLGILLVFALIRMGRLADRRERDPAYSLFAAFVAAFGVSLLMGVAAWVVYGGVFTATFLISGRKMIVVYPGLVGAGITAVVVFLGLFVAFWPRGDTSSKHDRGED
jgi:hypothetical protein